MALDGAFLHCIREELLPLTGSRIDKIYQPTRDELILSFRTKGGAVRVLFSVSADAARVHITGTSPENPPQPPMFCMLLRKHLSGGKQTMDETEYIMSSPKMVEILREGEKEIAEGNFETIAIDDLWK